MVKECTLTAGKLPPGGLPRKSVVRITDRLNMTSAVYVDVKQQMEKTKLGWKSR